MFTKEEAEKFLKLSGLLFDYDEDDDKPQFNRINLNDTFAWAVADFEEIPEDKLIEVADLLSSYGWCGVLYWVKKQRGEEHYCEFKDIARFIEFVEKEEEFKKSLSNSSKRAYTDYSYTLGKPNE